MKNTKIIAVSLPPHLVEALDLFVKDSTVLSRSTVVALAVEKLLKTGKVKP